MLLHPAVAIPNPVDIEGLGGGGGTFSQWCGTCGLTVPPNLNLNTLH